MEHAFRHQPQSEKEGDPAGPRTISSAGRAGVGEGAGRGPRHRQGHERPEVRKPGQKHPGKQPAAPDSARSQEQEEQERRRHRRKKVRDRRGGQRRNR